MVILGIKIGGHSGGPDKAIFIIYLNYQTINVKNNPSQRSQI